jgi:hypothetical protein
MRIGKKTIGATLITLCCTCLMIMLVRSGNNASNPWSPVEIGLGVEAMASHLGPYFAAEPQIVTMGPQPVIGQTFVIAVKLYNVTHTNVPTGVAGLEVHLTWNKTLIEPVSFLNKIGLSGGVLVGPNILFSFTPGFYDSGQHLISTPPYTNATRFQIAVASTSGPWWGDGGEVVEIKFQVLYQPATSQQPVTSTINFVYKDLADANGESVACETESGYYSILPLSLSPILSIRWNGTVPYPFVPSFVLREGEPMLVAANITGGVGGIVLAEVSYNVDNGEWWNTTMDYNVTTDLWVTMIPGQRGSTLEFFVTAYDNNGHQGTSPTYAINVRALLAGDLDGNGYVGLSDLVILAQHYGQHYP